MILTALAATMLPVVCGPLSHETTSSHFTPYQGQDKTRPQFVSNRIKERMHFLFPSDLSETADLALKAAGAKALDGKSQDQTWKAGRRMSTQNRHGAEHLYLRTPKPRGAFLQTRVTPGTSGLGPGHFQGLVPSNQHKASNHEAQVFVALEP